MVIGLLFLIFLAIACPRALRFLFALMVIGAIMAFGEGHAAPSSWVSHWHSLDEQCRGGSGNDPSTLQSCDKRSNVSNILIHQGCSFRYPQGWPDLRGEYWKCSRR